MADQAFDFKKEYKDLYLPKEKPMLIDVPTMNFIMVNGSGDPNNNPAFEQAIELLYGLSYAIKMSKTKGLQPDGYFDYVVPPLEGLWWVDDGHFSLEKRDNWKWTLMIRQPEFVTRQTFRWACDSVAKKKSGLEPDKAFFDSFTEGLCAQILHVGPYSTEPDTIKKLEHFVAEQGLKSRLARGGKHHEIYLSDPRKAKQESMKTVLRQPVYQ